MRTHPLLSAALAAVIVALCAPVALAAPSLRPPVDGATVLLAFGASYGSRTHSGLDLAAEGGAGVRAPVSGTVTFAGRLPSEEGEPLGVTITADDGRKVTCLPLDRLSVSKGAHVEAGASLGSVAAQGDESSAEPHVHLSVRQGELYLDPAPLLAQAAPPPAEPEPSEATAPSSASHSPAPAASVAVPSAVPQAVAAPVPHAVASQAAAGAASTAQLAAGTAAAVSRAAAAIRAPRLRIPLQPAAPPPVALPDMRPLAAHARSATMALGALMASAALLAPAWRRRPAVPHAGEPVPVRVET